MSVQTLLLDELAAVDEQAVQDVVKCEVFDCVLELLHSQVRPFRRHVRMTMCS